MIMKNVRILILALIFLISNLVLAESSSCSRLLVTDFSKSSYGLKTLMLEDRPGRFGKKLSSIYNQQVNKGKKEDIFFNADELSSLQKKSLEFIDRMSARGLFLLISVVNVSTVWSESLQSFKLEKAFVESWDTEFIKRLPFDQDPAKPEGFYFTSIENALKALTRRFEFLGPSSYKVETIEALVEMMSFRLPSGYMISSKLSEGEAVALDKILSFLKSDFKLSDELEMNINTQVPFGYVSKRLAPVVVPDKDSGDLPSGQDWDSSHEDIDYYPDDILNNGVYYDTDY